MKRQCVDHGSDEPPTCNNVSKKVQTYVDDSSMYCRDAIIRCFTDMLHMISFRPYPKILPPELARWHCYTLDGGHAIMCLISKMDFLPSFCDSVIAGAKTEFFQQPYRIEDVLASTSDEIEKWLAPVPAKAVLRDFKIERGYVVVNVRYDRNLGVVVDETDYEY